MPTMTQSPPLLSPAFASQPPFPLEELSHTVNFSVVIALEPAAHAQRSFCLELQLGSGARPPSVARVNNVETTGGGLGIAWMPVSTVGDFSSEMWLICRPGLQAPQVTAVLDKAVTRVRFDVELSTDCSRDDAITFWLHDDLGRYLPTSAPGAPGLLARVSWDRDGNFTAEGFMGDGIGEPVSACGFWGRVVAS